MQNIYVLFADHHQTLAKKGNIMIEKNDLPLLFSLVEPAIHQAMSAEFSNPANPKPIALVGDYYIIFHILRQYAENILRMDEQTLPKQIPLLEEKYTFIYTHRYPVRIGGRLDRVDLYPDGIHVIDYKTGRVDNKNQFSSMLDLFDRNTKKRKEYIFQIFLYAYLLAQNEYAGKTVVPQLLFIRESHQKDFEAGVFYKNQKQVEKVQSIQTYMDEFQQGLNGLLDEFFDPSIPYIQTSHLEKCQYCPYMGICNRKQ